MSALIFSDIHASKKACQELMKIISKHDLVICCGDVVGYGSEPEYCIDFVADNGIKIVKGNHEAMVLGESSITKHRVIEESIAWTKQRLSLKYLEKIRNYPISLELGGMYISHTLADKYIYGLSDVNDEVAAILENINKELIVIGHTHTQYCFSCKGKTVANPSSITKGRKGSSRGYMVYSERRFEFIPLKKVIV